MFSFGGLSSSTPASREVEVMAVSVSSLNAMVYCKACDGSHLGNIVFASLFI